MDDWSPETSCSQCSFCNLPLDKLCVRCQSHSFFMKIVIITSLLMRCRICLCRNSQLSNFSPFFCRCRIKSLQPLLPSPPPRITLPVRLQASLRANQSAHRFLQAVFNKKGESGFFLLLWSTAHICQLVTP